LKLDIGEIRYMSRALKKSQCFRAQCPVVCSTCAHRACATHGKEAKCSFFCWNIWRKQTHWKA